MFNLQNEFRPHPAFRSGNAQTLAAFYLFGHRLPEHAQLRHVPVSHDDALVLHDDTPAAWKPGDRITLLIHGLGGSHASSYMQRVAQKLNHAGVRTFRLDLRGCGAGVLLARRPYHSGQTDDVRDVIKFMQQLCPRSPVALVGFSMGGNMVLKYLGEAPGQVPPEVDRAVAVCPPVDLTANNAFLSTGFNRLYDRYFAKMLWKQLSTRKQLVPDLLTTSFQRPPPSLREFDEVFTGPLCGFGTAANYYKECSCGRFLSEIEVPTLILAASDDPVIPRAPLMQLRFSRKVIPWLTSGGGHLGYIGRKGADPDRRWMDWRVVEWIGSPADELPQGRTVGFTPHLPTAFDTPGEFGPAAIAAAQSM